MESADRELIQTLIKSNIQLKRLYEEHLNLDAEVEGYEGKTFLTTDEQSKLKALKMKKLVGVEAMMQILAEHRA